MEIIHSIDFGILDFLQTIHNDVLDFIMKFFTYAGDRGYIWISLCIILLCIPKTRKIGVYLAITLLVEVILNDGIVKGIVARERPFLQRTGIDTIIKQPSGYSFPSGHSASSFAAATAIFLKNKKLGLGALIVAFCIAFSRLYFYVHFPTDVICGSLFGVLIALVISKLGGLVEKKIAERKESKKTTE